MKWTECSGDIVNLDIRYFNGRETAVQYYSALFYGPINPPAVPGNQEIKNG